jgi:hypothetical protein
MAFDATARRRWIGAIFLLTALLMLVGGETILKGRLGDAGFLLFWLACLVFTSLAIFMAFLDVRALGQRVRHDQRELFEATLRKIEKDAKTKGNRPDGPGNGSKP